MKTECVKILCSLLSLLSVSFVGFFVSFFFCRFFDPGVFIFCAQTQTAMIFLFYLFQSILFVYFFDRFLGKKQEMAYTGHRYSRGHSGSFVHLVGNWRHKERKKRENRKQRKAKTNESTSEKNNAKSMWQRSVWCFALLKKCWWNIIKIHNTEEIARVLQILDYHIRVFILWKSYYISLT